MQVLEARLGPTRKMDGYEMRQCIELRIYGHAMHFSKLSTPDGG